MKKEEKSVLRGAVQFGLGTLSSRILGLIRDSLIASCLPLDMKDAWLAAFRLPNIFRRLLGEGGLSAAFVPQFVKASQGGARPAPRVVNGTFSLVFSVGFLVSVLGLILIPWAVPLWLQGQGFSDVPGKIEQTVQWAQIMFFFLLCMIVFSFLMALLNGLKKFSLTGFAPTLFNLTLIGVLLAFQDHPAIGDYAAFGILCGGLVQAGILIPAVYKTGHLPQFSPTDIFSDEVKAVVRKFLPTLLGVGVVQVLTFVNLYFASQLPKGTVTYMYLADRLLELPLSLIGVSLGTALLPTLSKHWAQRETLLFKETLFANMRLYLFLALPAAGGLFILGPEIVHLLFVRGEFTPGEVPVVANILKVYGLTLLCAGSLRLFNTSFYAVEDTLTPAYISLAGLVLHCFMAPFWMGLWGVTGLCFSTALALFFNLKIASFLFTRRYGRPQVKPFLVFFTKSSLVAGAMMMSLWFLKPYLPVEGSKWLLGFAILVTIGLGSILFFSLAQVLGIPENQKFLGPLLKRMGLAER